MHHLGHRQIAQLLADSHQLVHDALPFTHGLNLLAIEGNQLGIGQAPRNGLIGQLAGEQRIGAVFNDGAVGVLDQQELVSQGAAAQFAQAGEPLQEGLALLFELWVIERGCCHVVVFLLQPSSQTQAKTRKPAFISCTH